jgi:hypothetical protein
MVLELRTRKGEMLVKYDAMGRPRARFFAIESPADGSGRTLLVWRESRAGPEAGSVDLATVVGFRLGCTTANFDAAASVALMEGMGGPDPALSFSLVTGETTVDITAASKEQADLWIEALADFTPVKPSH